MPSWWLVNRVISDELRGDLLGAGGECRSGPGPVAQGVVRGGQQVDAELEERAVGDVEEVARAVVTGGELGVALFPAAAAGGAKQVPQCDQSGVLATGGQFGQCVDLGGCRGLSHGLGAGAQRGGGIA